jgi:hypothetical protein
MTEKRPIGGMHGCDELRFCLGETALTVYALAEGVWRVREFRANVLPETVIALEVKNGRWKTWEKIPASPRFAA